MAKSTDRQLVILPGAIDDIDELHRFFESVTPGLGDQFLDKLGEAFSRVLDHPGSFQYARSRKEEVRRGLVVKPPVIFLYRLAGNEIRILSVHDARSN